MNGIDSFYIKSRIFTGKKALSQLAEYSGCRVAVVTDGFMVSSGMLDQVLAHIGECESTVFSGVKPDPTVEVVVEGVGVIAPLRPEVVLAVGGGSTLDTAKAIMVSLREMPGFERMELVAVPTTSGTGSEVTEFAVISDAAKGIKFPLRSEDLLPDVAILAPELVKSVPPKITADTGMDVITHCIEAYVSLYANDFADALVEKALTLACKWLPVAYADGADSEAREKLHNASCMAGMAFNEAGLGLNHGIAHAVGATMHIPHGRINAMLLPLVIEYNAGLVDGVLYNEDIADRYAALTGILGGAKFPARRGAQSLALMVRRLNHKLGIPATMEESGADLVKYGNAISSMARAALDDITTTCNPRIPDFEDVEGLLRCLER